MSITLNLRALAFGAISFAISACASKPAMDINVSNPSDLARHGETVQIPLSDIAERLGEGFYRVNIDGEEIPSQVTYDSLLIFQVDLQPKASAKYSISRSDTRPAYDTIAVGRVYPERADDLAWENDLVGFRAYGPATQANKEKAFGYDIFFKHPNKKPVLADLYAAQTSRRSWQIVDSLRAISRKLADEYVKTFTYHIDHGQGMDCYAVGPTLGDGVAARLVNDSIVFPWCYESVDILDNGPLRFTARLKFAPVDNIVETRLITLDAGKHLNACTVNYSGLSDSTEIVVGVPRRDDSPAVMADNYIAYADPTQGKDNGKAMLGVLVPDRKLTAEERDGHILLRAKISPDESLRYYFGFAWDRADIGDMPRWTKYLTTYKQAPLIITYR